MLVSKAIKKVENSTNILSPSYNIRFQRNFIQLPVRLISLTTPKMSGYCSLRLESIVCHTKESHLLHRISDESSVNLFHVSVNRGRLYVGEHAPVYPCRLI